MPEEIKKETSLYVSEVAAWHIPTCRHCVTQNLQVTVEAYSRRSIPS
jgi:hypothetical protein